MPVHTHSPSCQTKTYPAKCRDCRQDIFILQCTCGSAVLFDKLGAPWPKHGCARAKGTAGVGDSGFSGWEAVDRLRSQGVPIMPDIMQMAFSGRAQSGFSAEPELEIKQITPLAGENQSLIAIVRELISNTKQTKEVQDMTEVSCKKLGLDPREQYQQITLVDNKKRPNESFTALIPGHMALDIRKHVFVMAEISAHVRGSFACWVVTDINTF